VSREQSLAFSLKQKLIIKSSQNKHKLVIESTQIQNVTTNVIGSHACESCVFVGACDPWAIVVFPLAVQKMQQWSADLAISVQYKLQC